MHDISLEKRYRKQLMEIEKEHWQKRVDLEIKSEEKLNRLRIELTELKSIEEINEVIR